MLKDNENITVTDEPTKSEILTVQQGILDCFNRRQELDQSLKQFANGYVSCARGLSLEPLIGSFNLQLQSNAFVNAQKHLQEILRPFAESQQKLNEALHPILEQNAKIKDLIHAASPLMAAFSKNLVFPKLEIPEMVYPHIGDLLNIARGFTPLVESLRNSIPKLTFLTQTSEEFWGNQCPSNWEGIKVSSLIGSASTLALNEGIAIINSMSPEVTIKFLEANNTADCRSVLGRNSTQIASYCYEVIKSCNIPNYKFEKELAIEAIEALMDQKYMVSQATFTIVLDSLLNKIFDKGERRKITNYQKGKELPDVIDKMSFLEFILWAPILKAHETYWADRGDRVPVYYNRHASVHNASRRQYNKRNCVQSLMLVTSIMKRTTLRCA